MSRLKLDNAYRQTSVQLKSSLYGSFEKKKREAVLPLHDTDRLAPEAPAVPAVASINSEEVDKNENLAKNSDLADKHGENSKKINPNKQTDLSLLNSNKKDSVGQGEEKLSNDENNNPSKNGLDKNEQPGVDAPRPEAPKPEHDNKPDDSLVETNEENKKNQLNKPDQDELLKNAKDAPKTSDDDKKSKPVKPEDSTSINDNVVSQYCVNAVFDLLEKQTDGKSFYYFSVNLQAH